MAGMKIWATTGQGKLFTWAMEHSYLPGPRLAKDFSQRGRIVPAFSPTGNVYGLTPVFRKKPASTRKTELFSILSANIAMSCSRAASEIFEVLSVRGFCNISLFSIIRLKLRHGTFVYGVPRGIIRGSAVFFPGNRSAAFPMGYSQNAIWQAGTPTP